MKVSALLKPGLRLVLIVGVGLSVIGQFTGVNIVVYYVPAIRENTGYYMAYSKLYKGYFTGINKNHDKTYPFIIEENKKRRISNEKVTRNNSFAYTRAEEFCVKENRNDKIPFRKALMTLTGYSRPFLQALRYIAFICVLREVFGDGKGHGGRCGDD